MFTWQVDARYGMETRWFFCQALRIYGLTEGCDASVDLTVELSMTADGNLPIPHILPVHGPGAHHRSISAHVSVTVIDILLSRPRDDDG